MQRQGQMTDEGLPATPARTEQPERRTRPVAGAPAAASIATAVPSRGQRRAAESGVADSGRDHQLLDRCLHNDLYSDGPDLCSRPGVLFVRHVPLQVAGMTDESAFPEQDALQGVSTSTTSTFEEGGEPIVASYADGDSEAPVTAVTETGEAGAGSARGEAGSGEAAGGEAEAEAEAEEPPAPPESPYDRPGRWYVIHSYAGYENKVKSNLQSRIASMNMEERIFEVVIPMEDVVEIKNGKKQVVSQEGLPGLPASAPRPRRRLLVRGAQHPRCYRVRRSGHPAHPVVSARTSRASCRSRRRKARGSRRARAGRASSTSSGESVRVARAVRRLQRHHCRDQRGPAEAEGAGQHLWTGDPRRIGLRPSGEALRGAIEARRWPSERVTAIVKIQLPAGKATPAPPVARPSGLTGFRPWSSSSSTTRRPRTRVGQVIPVEITIFEDRSFSFVLKTPPTPIPDPPSHRRGEGLSKLSGRETVGTIADAQLAEIAQIKMPDLNANDLEAAKAPIAGTARSMGVKVG